MYTIVLDYLLLIISVVLCIPSLVFFVQAVIGSVVAGRRMCCTEAQEVSPSIKRDRPSVGVLIPAHNEAKVIRETLDVVQSQLLTGDRLFLVADNCSDNTSEIANTLGVRVIERTDHQRRGKGYAIQAGLAALSVDPPEVIVFLDADCRLGPGCLDQLAVAAISEQRPVQGAYIMLLPTDPTLKDRLSAFAVVTKNVIRPAGMERLGLPCLLTGSGFAMPWSVAKAVPFDGEDLVEDMKISIDLTMQGSGPKFCRRARVTAPLPQCVHAANSQRTRWEHGHLRTIQSQSPRLVGSLLQRPRLSLLGMLLDLSVPPLSMLVLGVACIVLIQTALVASGRVGYFGYLAFSVSISSLLMVFAACGMAWNTVGRQFIGWSDLVWGVPSYVLGKLPRFAKFIWRPERKWIRTAR